jgi:Family of unknown function (DUF6011)
LKAVVDFLTAGSNSFRKPPRIDFGTFSLSLSRSGKWAGHVFANKPGGFGSGYYCYIKPNFQLSDNAPDWVVEQLREFAKDPAEYAGAYGKKTGSCCFCSQTLTDPRSVTVGYGPVCANRWFLPWGEESPKIVAQKKEPKLKEKEKNEEHWKRLKETYGEVISVVEDQQFYRHRIGAASFFIYGESIKDMAEDYGCYWLLDAIASYQYQARSHPQMKTFQMWELKTNIEKKEAVLTGSWDSGSPLYRQRIPSVSFPKSYVKFYLENDTLTLVDER